MAMLPLKQKGCYTKPFVVMVTLLSDYTSRRKLPLVQWRTLVIYIHCHGDLIVFG